MTIWQGVLIILATIAAPLGVYALYHAFLWMTRRGWFSMRRRQSGTSPMSCFVAMQQFLEPTIKHVHEVKTRHRTGGSKAPEADGAREAGSRIQ